MYDVDKAAAEMNMRVNPEPRLNLDFVILFSEVFSVRTHPRRLLVFSSSTTPTNYTRLTILTFCTYLKMQWDFYWQEGSDLRHTAHVGAAELARGDYY